MQVWSQDEKERSKKLIAIPLLMKGKLLDWKINIPTDQFNQSKIDLRLCFKPLISNYKSKVLYPSIAKNRVIIKFMKDFYRRRK